MFTKEARILGGKAASRVIKDRNIKAYNENPNICLNCGSAIEIGKNRVCDTKKKKFCDQSCAAKYNNKIYKKRVKKYKPKIVRKKAFDYLIGLTKGELIEQRSNWQSWRATILKNASHVYNKTESSVCENCGYNKHIQICHIKPVSKFKDSDLISNINSKDNLVGLCPNCHWEFDNGLLKLKKNKA